MSKAHCYAQLKPHALAIVLMSVLGCSKKAADPPPDPLAASSRITALAAKNCAGLAEAIAQLAPFHGRILIELVDDALAVAPKPCTLDGTSAAAQLARARLAEPRHADALALLTLAREPAICIRRAELLDQLGRPADALGELATLNDADDATQTMRRLLAASIAARAADPAVGALVDAAPVTERRSLAFRAAADAPAAALASLVKTAPAELATAIGDRIEKDAGPAAALAARQRAVAADADIAEHHDALARAQIASGEITAAMISWDRAASLAPAQAAYRITPIHALLIANQPALAKQRAVALAAVARADADDVELRLTASLAAATAGDHALAIALGTEALALRPTDGRLAFELAHRHAEAGDRAAAAQRYAELLICGAHGKPWHRHEVAAKLAALGDAAPAALAAKPACEVVEPDDLATYTQPLR